MKRIVFCIVAVVIATVSTYAQKVYSTNYEYQADVKVFVVDYEYQADLLVYKESQEYDASGNEGKWYFVDKEYQADVKIYFVKNEYQAGWRDKSKMYLLY